MEKVLDRLTEQGLLERIGSGEYAHYRLKSGRT
jgi:predicted transcriptional regulator of viral defense system